MKPALTILAALAVTIAFLAAGCGGGNTAPSNRGKKADDKISRPDVPTEYRDLAMPAGISAEEGKKQFLADCASCHGDGGLGDGPVGKALVPPAGNLTDPRLHEAVGDDYFFWRISEGGAFAPFNSGMTPFKSKSEEQRWQLVAFIRTLKK